VPALKQFAIVLTAVFSVWWLVNVVVTIRGVINKSILDVTPTFKGDIPYL